MIRPRPAVTWALTDQALVSGSGFLTTVLLVRWLGLDAFGSFSLLWLGVLLAVGLGQALIGQPALTIAPKLEHGSRAQREYLGALWVLELGYSLLVLVVGWLAYGAALRTWGEGGLTRCLWPVTWAAVGRQAQAFARALLFAQEARRRVVFIDAVAYPGQLLALGWLAAVGRLDLPGALWVVAATSAAATIAACIGRPWRTSREALRSAVRRHWRSGRWLAAMQILQLCASNAFVVAAAALLGAGAAGAIKAAQGVIGVLHVGFLAMENFVPVSAARLYVRGGSGALARYLAHVGRVGTAATIALSVALAAGARPLLALVYHRAAGAELVTALRAFALLYVFAFAVTLLQIAFRTVEHTRPVFLAYVATTLVALAVAEPVVRRFGFSGAVAGMAGLQGLMAALLLAAFLLLQTPRGLARRSSGRPRDTSVPDR